MVLGYCSNGFKTCAKVNPVRYILNAIQSKDVNGNRYLGSMYAIASCIAVMPHTVAKIPIFTCSVALVIVYFHSSDCLVAF